MELAVTRPLIRRKAKLGSAITTVWAELVEVVVEDEELELPLVGVVVVHQPVEVEVLPVVVVVLVELVVLVVEVLAGVETGR